MKARWVSKDCSDFVYCENCDARFWYYKMQYIKKCPICNAELSGYLDLDKDEEEKTSEFSDNLRRKK